MKKIVLSIIAIALTFNMMATNIWDGSSVLNDKTVLKTKFHFETNVDAFDAACAAIKKVLGEVGYVEKEGAFVK